VKQPLIIIEISEININEVNLLEDLIQLINHVILKYYMNLLILVNKVEIHLTNNNIKMNSKIDKNI